MEGVEERAQRDAHAPPLAEAVLAAERDSLRVSQDERGIGAVLISFSCSAGIQCIGDYWDLGYPRRVVL